MTAIGTRRLLPALLSAALLLLLGTVPGSAASPERVTLPHGILIQVPAGWRIAEGGEPERSREGHVYANPDIEKRVREAGTTETLIVLAKHPADHIGLNPSIQISRTPLPESMRGIAPDKLIERVLPTLTHVFHDVRQEQWVPSTTLGGRKAARAAATYTMHGKSGSAIPSRASLAVVVADDVYFVVGMSSPAGGQDDARPEFEQFLKTIRFAEPKAVEEESPQEPSPTPPPQPNPTPVPSENAEPIVADLETSLGTISIDAEFSDIHHARGVFRCSPARRFGDPVRCDRDRKDGSTI